VTSGTTIGTTVGLRELKKQRTYEELQRVALALFAARGFDQVTIEDICADAEVSKTTFYRYFDSKEDVLLGTSHQKLAEMAAALAQRPASEAAIVAVRNAFLEVAAEYQSQRKQKLAVNRIVRATPSLAARNLEQQTAWEDLLREFFVVRDGVDGPALSHCVLAANVVASLRTAMEYWLNAGADSDLPTVVDEALRLSVAVPARRGARAR
jgi:AcrR family transcriptional regulator